MLLKIGVRAAIYKTEYGMQKGYPDEIFSLLARGEYFYYSEYLIARNPNLQ